MSRMKDDERRLLAAAQSGDDPVPMTNRVQYLIRKWCRLGWMDAETGKLTERGQSIKTGVAEDSHGIQGQQWPNVVDEAGRSDDSESAGQAFDRLTGG